MRGFLTSISAAAINFIRNPQEERYGFCNFYLLKTLTKQLCMGKPISDF